METGMSDERKEAEEREAAIIAGNKERLRHGR